MKHIWPIWPIFFHFFFSLSLLFSVLDGRRESRAHRSAAAAHGAADDLASPAAAATSPAAACPAPGRRRHAPGPRRPRPLPAPPPAVACPAPGRPAPGRRRPPAVVACPTPGRRRHCPLRRPSLQKTIDRYLNHIKGSTPANDKALEAAGVQMCRSEATALKQKIDAIEAYQRKLSGEGLGSCSAQELHELELQLEKSLSNIRQKKENKMMEQILELREKEEKLLRENSVLREEYEALPLLELATRSVEAAAAAARSPGGGQGRDDDEEEERGRRYMDVETDLVIGRPGTSS